MKKEYLTLPNLITSIRLLGAIVLLFLKPLSIPFFIVFIISGLSDAVDGFVARKMGGESEFGAKLDSVSDLSFYAVSFGRLIPYLYEQLPKTIWYFVGGVIIFRIFMYTLNALLEKQLLTSHTYLNKATSVMLFFIPFFINKDLLAPYCWVVLGIGIVAAIYEFTFSLYDKYFKKK